MEKNTQLSVEVATQIEKDATVRYRATEEGKLMAVGYYAGATAYATKLHLVEQENAELRRQNDKMKEQAEGWRPLQPSLTMQQEKKLREQAEQFFEDAIRQLDDPERKEEVEGERETYIGVWMRGYRAGEAAPASGREEDAVAFLAWIQKNDYYYSTHGGGYWYEWNEKEQETYLCNTNDELYKLFKKEAK